MITSSRWFKHCKTEEDKERFEKRLVLVKDVMRVLSDLINEDLETVNRKCRDEENFTKPAWAEHQAYMLGQQKAFEKVLKIISNKE